MGMILDSRREQRRASIVTITVLGLERIASESTHALLQDLGEQKDRRLRVGKQCQWHEKIFSVVVFKGLIGISDPKQPHGPHCLFLAP